MRVTANVSRVSRDAPIDRNVVIVDADVQNRRDLVDAQRRRLQGRVGRPGATV